MGQCLSNRSDDLINDIHENIFSVLNIDESGSRRIEGRIEVTETHLILNQRGRDPIKWPLKSLRRYGFEAGVFSFESGRRCPTGPGIYAFRCTRAQNLFNLLQSRVRNTNTAPDGNGRHQNPNWTDHAVDERDGTPTPEPRERNVSTITTTTTTTRDNQSIEGFIPTQAPDSIQQEYENVPTRIHSHPHVANTFRSATPNEYTPMENVMENNNIPSNLQTLPTELPTHELPQILPTSSVNGIASSVTPVLLEPKEEERRINISEKPPPLVLSDLCSGPLIRVDNDMDFHTYENVGMPPLPPKPSTPISPLHTEVIVNQSNSPRSNRPIEPAQTPISEGRKSDAKDELVAVTQPERELNYCPLDFTHCNSQPSTNNALSPTTVFNRSTGATNSELPSRSSDSLKINGVNALLPNGIEKETESSYTHIDLDRTQAFHEMKRQNEDKEKFFDFEVGAFSSGTIPEDRAISTNAVKEGNNNPLSNVLTKVLHTPSIISAKRGSVVSQN